MESISFDKLKSRKLWAAISAAVVVMLNSKFSLGIDKETIGSLTWIVVGYLAAQGGVDVATALKK